MNRTSNAEVKEEISALSQLLRRQGGRVRSAKDILEQYNVSESTQHEIKRQMGGRQVLFEEPFRFVAEEFSRHVAFKTVELSSGALLTASSEKFEDVFRSEVVDRGKKVVRITAEGKVVDQRFRKAK